MNEEELSMKASKIVEIPKVQEENAISLATPYYWSWYRCIFSRHDSRPGEERGIPTMERQ
jgi:hypothetical protein